METKYNIFSHFFTSFKVKIIYLQKCCFPFWITRLQFSPLPPPHPHSHPTVDIQGAEVGQFKHIF